MARASLGGSLVSLVLIAGAAACAERAPVAPEPTVELLGAPPLAGRGAAGNYALEFVTTGYVVVTSLPVGKELGLWARVTDASGAPVTAGGVTFQYCAAHGQPAPLAACQGGSGRWTNHMTTRLYNGEIFASWGTCHTPRTIGFRFQYTSKGSSVADGTSAARDFTFTAS